MAHIVLTEEQTRILAQAQEPVELRDAHGQPVARIVRFSPEEMEMIARARKNQAAGGPRVPSAQVRSHLQRLEEIGQQEELTESRVLDILGRMRVGEA
jgi:hypothetical protein